MQTQSQIQIKTEKPLEDKWKKATLSNNFIFYKVMRDHIPACQKLMQTAFKKGHWSVEKGTSGGQKRTV